MNHTLIVGDTLDFPTSVSGYPASAGYTLTYRLIPLVPGTPITILAGANGDDYRTQVEAVTTATWAAGQYSWFAEISKALDKFIVDSGVLTLKPNPRTITGYDGRSPARKALDAIDAGLATFGANAHIQEYTIANRHMRFSTQAELIAMRSQLKDEVWREEAAAKMAAGMPNPRNIHVRFGPRARTGFCR